MCSQIYPRCSPTAGVFFRKPCRRLCEEVQRSCESLFTPEDRRWAFRCDLLPTSDQDCLLPANYKSKPILPSLPLNKSTSRIRSENFQATAPDMPQLVDEWTRFPNCKQNTPPMEQVRKYLRILLYQFDKPCQVFFVSDFLDEIDAKPLPKNRSSTTERQLIRMTSLLEALSKDVKRLKADSHARQVVRSIQSLLMKTPEV